MSNYKPLDKILNQQFLGDNPLSNFLFQRLLCKAQLNKSDLNLKHHIFITGYARSGTTAILNQLYGTNQLSSFLYKHMPFILSPKLASLAAYISKNEKIEKQRLHQDGIMFNNSSPECLDEVYWIKSTKNYNKNHLKEIDNININILLGYENLLTSFSNIQNSNRLIIKNNNNHIRLNSLSDYFNYCDFLVIFRNPIYHSYSLLKTHKRFYKLQENDPYILEYMNLIGHREFGKGLKKFVYKDILIKNFYKPNSINYWLCNWINCYSWILSNKLYKKKNVHLIQYEKLCRNESNLEDLYRLLNLKLSNKNNLILKNKLSSKQKINLNIDSELKKLSIKIFNKLKKYSF